MSRDIKILVDIASGKEIVREELAKVARVSIGTMKQALEEVGLEVSPCGEEHVQRAVDRCLEDLALNRIVGLWPPGDDPRLVSLYAYFMTQYMMLPIRNALKGEEKTETQT